MDGILVISGASGVMTGRKKGAENYVIKLGFNRLLERHCRPPLSLGNYEESVCIIPQNTAGQKIVQVDLRHVCHQIPVPQYSWSPRDVRDMAG